MSAVWMLDANAISALVKGQADRLSKTLEQRAFCISVITEAELRFGLARRPVNADLRSIIESLLRATDIRSWNSTCTARYGHLRAELDALDKPLGPMDLLIATQALAEDCCLVSADQAFAQVPGLRILDWTAVSPN